jgi:hypothetical protein
MTNPTVDTQDGPDADASFLQDFESSMAGTDTTPLFDDERSSESPAADPAVPAEPTTEPDAPIAGDPAPAASTSVDTPEPVTYTVNGQQKSLDWALKVGDNGVVIPQASVAKFQDTMQRAEWNEQQNRDLYAKTQQYEALSHTVGEQEYRGVQAFQQLKADFDQLNVSGGALFQSLNDPNFVVNLALAHQSGDPAAVQAVLDDRRQQVRFVGEKARFDTERGFVSQANQQSETQSLESQKSREFTSIIEQYGKAFPTLTPDDLTYMRDYFGQMQDKIFRPASMAEAQQYGVRVGQIIRDPTIMTTFAQRQAAINQQSGDRLRAAEKAAAENRTRLTNPTAPKPKGKSRATTPTKPNAKDARFDGDDGTYTAWKSRLEAGKWAHDSSTDD